MARCGCSAPRVSCVRWVLLDFTAVAPWSVLRLISYPSCREMFLCRAGYNGAETFYACMQPFLAHLQTLYRSAPVPSRSRPISGFRTGSTQELAHLQCRSWTDQFRLLQEKAPRQKPQARKKESHDSSAQRRSRPSDGIIFCTVIGSETEMAPL